MGLLQKTTSISAPDIAGIEGLKEDFPIPSRRIILELGGKPVGLFESISGMSVKRDTVSFTEGGQNEMGVELPGPISYGHVKLKAGLTSTDFFFNWMVEGQYAGYANNQSKMELKLNRHTPDGASEEYLTWAFINPFPVAWSISDLSVTDSKSIVIETLEISFDYFHPTMV
jgi:phage tail-like protein